MARLTRREIRIREATAVIGFALTLALIVLAFVYAGTSDWLFVAIMFIDVPVLLILALMERVARTRA